MKIILFYKWPHITREQKCSTTEMYLLGNPDLEIGVYQESDETSSQIFKKYL